MSINRDTRDGIRRIAGFAIALVIGSVLAVLAFWLPPALQDSGVDRVPVADRPIAERALRDAELAFFDDGVERYLVTLVFVESVTTGDPPDACPEGTVYHARVLARTAFWIPYDDVLWCGDDLGEGIFVTRQA